MHQSQTPSHSQAPDRGTNCVQRTSDPQHTRNGQTHKAGRSFDDTSYAAITGHNSSGPTPKDRRVTPEDRQTVPARHSFEEKQYELVRKSVIGIEAARQNVERYRELRNASAARLIGGAA